MVAIFVGLALYLLIAGFVDRSAAHKIRHASVCTAASTKDCIRVRHGTMIRAFEKYGKAGNVSDWLDFTTGADHHSINVALIDLKKFPQGAPVTYKTWNGKAMEIDTADGYEAQSLDDPRRYSGNFVWAIVGLVAALALLIFTRWQARQAS